VLELHPKEPWNYGLIIDEKDPASSFELIQQNKRFGQVFHGVALPWRLMAKGRRIDGWQLDKNGLIGALQPSPARVEPGEPEDVMLIPMGGARIRVTVIPTVSTSEKAHTWKAPVKSPSEAK
jgi:urease beta subunit